MYGMWVPDVSYRFVLDVSGVRLYNRMWPKMMEEYRQKWLTNAVDTIAGLDNLDPDKASKEQFWMLGASLAVIDEYRDKPTETTEKGGDADLSFECLLAIIEHEIDDADIYFAKNQKVAAKSELSHVATYIERARSKVRTREDVEAMKDIQAKYNILKQSI